MSSLRCLQCHLLTVILIAVAVGLFTFRSEIRQDFAKLTGAEAKTAAVHTTQTISSAKKRVPAPESKREPLSKQTNQKSSKEKASLNLEKPALTPQLVSSPSLPQYPNQPVNGKLLSSDNSARAVTVPDSQFPPEGYDPETNSAENTEAVPITKTADNASYFRGLEDARRLNWQGKLDVAQKMYERLMFDYQLKPEAAAELGDMLIKQGNKSGAIWAYEIAIPRYLNLHREQEAISIMKLLSQYDPAIVEKLQKKYWQ